MSISKPDLRRMYLDQRKRIPPEEAHRAAQEALGLFSKRAVFSPDSVIAGYWPTRGELDVRPILRELSRRGHKCALPHITVENAPLAFRVWDETTPMIVGKYDIPEPAMDMQVTPDVLLVPIVAFDENCHRLGYGAGYYDRTLAALKKAKPVLAIGMAYESQKCDKIPAGEYDIKLDKIITDRNVYT